MRSSLGASLVIVFALTGCQPVSTPENTTAEPEDSLAEAMPGEEDVPEPSDTPPEANPEMSLQPCGDQDKGAIDQAIASQVQALANRDYDAAYSFASPSFQAGVSLEMFTDIIRVSYTPLLSATNARSGSCEANATNSLATILVRFDTATDPTYTLRYVMELVEGQWRISGANQEAVSDSVA